MGGLWIMSSPDKEKVKEKIIHEMTGLIAEKEE